MLAAAYLSVSIQVLPFPCSIPTRLIKYITALSIQGALNGMQKAVASSQDNVAENLRVKYLREL